MITKVISFIASLNWIKVTMILLAIVCALLATYIFKMGNDNVVEQTCERVIENQTGITVDFSPGN